MTTVPVFRVDNLTTTLRINGHDYQAVRDVSFEVAAGETLALVGESGCGKSLTAMTIMGLLPEGVGHLSAGKVYVDDKPVSGLSDAAMAKIRGRDIGMIFQDPMSSLNPVMKIGEQIAEPLIYHQGMRRKAALKRAKELMDLVRIPAAEKRLHSYPHEFSGGMRQRVMIAIAIACSPRVLIADEPTTALDVTVQEQVLELLQDLQRDYGLGQLIITHNLGVVASNAQRVIVMYGGDVVESGPVEAIFDEPLHPYTKALIATLPRVDRDVGDLAPIPGQVPALTDMPEGCRFQGRCLLRTELCEKKPPLRKSSTQAGHEVRCWHVKNAEPVNVTYMQEVHHVAAS